MNMTPQSVKDPGSSYRLARASISGINRRRFLQASMACAAGALTDVVQAAAPISSSQPTSGKSLPSGKIGKLQISRLILGSNLITGYIHARDLKFVNNLGKQYNTEAKILET